MMLGYGAGRIVVLLKRALPGRNVRVLLGNIVH
jgi:hypothetical protein